MAMERKHSIPMAGVALLLATGGVLLAACQGASAATSAVTPDQSLPAAATVPAAVSEVAEDELTREEIEGLYWMREEEKLARDVYLAMFDLWGLPTFENIAASESRHMEAVLGVIEAYGLEDPVSDDTPGVFSNPDLAALYVELVEVGSESLVAALTVGATIEDLDIADLEEELAIADRADLRRVYENLLRGSVNHLRGFTGRLEAEGAEYEAVHHTEEELAALLAEGGDRGRQRRGR
jgi:hypothetical protein